MKRRYIRVVAFVIAISVLFVQVDTVSVNAVANAPIVEQGYPQIQSVGFVAEWIAGLGVSAGRLVAFAFVLTLLGFVVENGISNVWENREEYLSYLTNLKEDCTSWCAESKEWCSLKVNDFDMWLDMIAQGTLDKTSDCWQAIKDYCVDLKSRIDASDNSQGNSNVIAVENASAWLNTYLNSGVSNSVNTTTCNTVANSQDFVKETLSVWKNREFYRSECTELVTLIFSNTVYLVAINPNWKKGLDFYANCGIGCQYMDASLQVYSSDGSVGAPAFSGCYVWGGSLGDLDLSVASDNVYQIDYKIPKPWEISYWQMQTALYSFATGLVNGYDDWAIEIPKDDGITDEVVQGLTVAGGTSGVIERDGSLDNVDVVGVSGAKDDAIPIDWDNVTVEDLSQPYPYDDVKTIDLVDGVIVGTDTPIDKVVPPIDGSDTSSDRNNYTLSGLTELFPFCIPFDLVMLFQTLKADAVAPCFTWKFVYYVDGEKKVEDIVLDLSKFNKVAEIVRMMELLAFMIALTIKTRDLIRG